MSSSGDAVKVAPFQGGQKLMQISAVLGVLGLAATGFGFATNPGRAAPGYLVAFAYWVGISIGALFFLSIFHAAGGKWMTVFRRQMEHIAFAVVLGIVFFIPIILFREKLYVWTLPHDQMVQRLGAHGAELVGVHKAPYLNVTAWVIRSVVFFSIFSGVAFLLNKWSLAQDGKAPDEATRTRFVRLASGAIPFLGLAMTFAAVDWIMSLEPEWASSMFGVYYFSGSFLAALAVLTLTTVLPTDANLHGAFVKGSHLHNLGKLLLAFTSFWAYIGFSQLLILWHANIPEEAPWYFARGIQGLSRWSVHQVFSGNSPNTTSDMWFPVTMFLVFGHFILPFVALLSWQVKYMRKYLAVMALWLLAAHYIDLFWAVMPSMRLIDDALAAPHVSWMDLAAFVGIGGIGVAFVVFRMRGKLALPVSDPTLGYSLAYKQPLTWEKTHE